MVSTGPTDEAEELALIEEVIAETERDIAEATDILAGTETENEETQNENVIHPDLQVPTVEHTYNLRQRKQPWTYYTNRYVFQTTIAKSQECDTTAKPQEWIATKRPRNW